MPPSTGPACWAALQRSPGCIPPCPDERAETRGGLGPRRSDPRPSLAAALVAPGRLTGPTLRIRYSSSRASRPSSSIWTKSLVSNASWRGANGETSSRAGPIGRELDDDPLVALDEGVDEQLVGAGLELEVLERIDVEGDRQRREVGRGVVGVDDDPLDPAGPVRDDLAAAQVAVA